MASGAPQRTMGPPTHRNWAQQGLLVLAGAATIVLAMWYDASEWPRLSEVGTIGWEARCAGAGRACRVESDAPVGGSSGMTSILRRGLAFLDAQGRTRYYTMGFEPEAMETDAVWRFRYRERDARLVAPGERSEVLAGDEVAFGFARDLTWMTVETRTGESLRIDCARVR